MKFKKFFMPILSDGDDLRDKIYSALLVSKYYKAHLEILHSIPGVKMNRQLPKHILDDLKAYANEQQDTEAKRFNELLKGLSKETGVELSKGYCEDKVSVHALIQLGDKSSMIAQESKFSDMVVMVSPLNGEITESFEAAVLYSGKPVMVLPRHMKSFDTKSIIIAWNNSQEAARAVTASIDILKQAQKVHLVSSPEYLEEGDNLEKIKEYLSIHGVEITTELLKTTMHPGESLLNTAQNGNFDMIVIGAYGHDGLKELMFGGATKYLLKNSKLPMFMSH